MATDMSEKNAEPINEKNGLHQDGPEESGEGYESNILRDGVKLHPQPTADPLDPLNWTSFRKHTILAIVMFKYASLLPSVVNPPVPGGSSSSNPFIKEVSMMRWIANATPRYFMFTYITTTTVPSFAQLQTDLNITYSQVNWTVAIPALGLAVGPLFWSSLSDIYGRRIIFIIGTIISLAATIGAAKPGSYGGYMAARFFQGFGVSPGATVGMATVGDLFFEYERGQKLGLWVLAIDSGLLVGPILGGFIDLVSDAWIQWFTAILFATLLVLELAFMSETLYPRNYMIARMPYTSSSPATTDIEKLPDPKGDASSVDLKRTKNLPFINITPVPGMHHPKPWDSVVRFILTFKYSIVVISVGIYCFAWYWWVLSIITMLPAAYASYAPQIQGLLFLGLLLGTLFSEVFCSGRLGDYIVMRLARQNDGVRVPEMRLWLGYPAATLSAIGLIIWGASVDKGYHWIVGQIAFFLFAAGIQMGNTVIT